MVVASIDLSATGESFMLLSYETREGPKAFATSEYTGEFL